MCVPMLNLQCERFMLDLRELDLSVWHVVRQLPFDMHFVQLSHQLQCVYFHQLLERNNLLGVCVSMRHLHNGDCLQDLRCWNVLVNHNLQELHHWMCQLHERD